MWRIGVLLLWWSLLLLLLLLLMRIRLLGKRLAVSTIQLLGRGTLVTPHCVCRDECLCLRRDWRKDTFLLKSLAIGATSVL